MRIVNKVLKCSCVESTYVPTDKCKPIEVPLGTLAHPPTLLWPPLAAKVYTRILFSRLWREKSKALFTFLPPLAGEKYEGRIVNMKKSAGFAGRILINTRRELLLLPIHVTKGGLSKYDT